ncbi:LptA/OstA family protein [Shumkonia mesophila]|uniref:LptA/OstA family protein n=1 Tax=Shumkonia mesophila TaxID=2838854 RepID=UPI0029349EB0|nr:LptA/OstA family protein [Shumkonia mesophila]
MTRIRPRLGTWLIVAWAGLLVGAGPAAGQGLNFSNPDSAVPIEVTADDGIEWQQEKQLFLARGNARATRGEVAVNSDLLRAFYRKKAEGGTDIYRLEAVGAVRIVSAGETAFGENAVYDVDKGIMVLSGKEVKLVAAEDTITADQQLEYYDAKQMAVARGHAVAQRADRKIRTDVLVAYFQRDAAGKSRVYRVDAFDNVHITTAQEQVWADRGVYNVDSAIATLSGNVKLVRGENTLVGCSAEVNLKTGISKLKSCEGQGRGVRGLLKADETPGLKNRTPGTK